MLVLNSAINMTSSRRIWVTFSPDFTVCSKEPSVSLEKVYTLMASGSGKTFVIFKENGVIKKFGITKFKPISNKKSKNYIKKCKSNAILLHIIEKFIKRKLKNRSKYLRRKILCCDSKDLNLDDFLQSFFLSKINEKYQTVCIFDYSDGNVFIEFRITFIDFAARSDENILDYSFCFQSFPNSGATAIA